MSKSAPIHIIDGSPPRQVGHPILLPQTPPGMVFQEYQNTRQGQWRQNSARFIPRNSVLPILQGIRESQEDVQYGRPRENRLAMVGYDAVSVASVSIVASSNGLASLMHSKNASATLQDNPVWKQLSPGFLSSPQKHVFQELAQEDVQDELTDISSVSQY